MNIGLIGFGRIGAFFCTKLSEDFKVYVYEIEDKKNEIVKAGGNPTSLEDVCKQDLIIPCVPYRILKS